MSADQLNEAYSLIKSGQVQDAIDILEPIIRNDRDNEDAWWLLANATNDSDAKRNALNNVIRLSANDNRTAKAKQMLQELDADPFGFDFEQAKSKNMSAYRETSDMPEKSTRRGLSCANIALIIVGLVGVCACVGAIGLYTFAGGLFEAINYPENYDILAPLEGDEDRTGELTTELPADGYRYEGEAGDTIEVTIDSDATYAPIIVIYDEDRLPVAFSQPDVSSQVDLTYTLDSSGDYLITLRSFEFLGQAFGFGEYEMTFETR